MGRSGYRILGRSHPTRSAVAFRGKLRHLFPRGESGVEVFAGGPIAAHMPRPSTRMGSRANHLSGHRGDAAAVLRGGAEMLGVATLVVGSVVLADALRFSDGGEWPLWLPSGLAIAVAVVWSGRARLAMLGVLVLAVTAGFTVVGGSAPVGVARGAQAACEALVFVVVAGRWWTSARALDSRLSVLHLFGLTAVCAGAGAMLGLAEGAALSELRPDGA